MTAMQHVLFSRNLASRECTAGLTDDEEENIIRRKNLRKLLRSRVCAPGRPALGLNDQCLNFLTRGATDFAVIRMLRRDRIAISTSVSRTTSTAAARCMMSIAPQVLSNCRPGPHHPPLTHVLIAARMKCDAPFFRCCGNPKGLVPTTRTKQCNVNIYNCLKATKELSALEK